MPKVLIIAGRELKEQLREPAMAILMVVMALVFTFAVGLMFGGQGPERVLSVLIYDNERSGASQAFVSELQKAPGLKVTAAGEKSPEPEAAVREKTVSVAVVIPEGYAADLEAMRTPTITVFARSDSTDGLVVREVLGRSLLWTATSLKAADLISARPALSAVRPVTPEGLEAARAADLKALNEAWAEGPKVTTSLKEVGSKTPPRAGFQAATTATVAGFTVMFLMYPATFGAASILEERMRGTWHRLLTTPTGGMTLVVGKLLGVFVYALVQALVIVAASHYLFGVNWGSSIPALVLVMTSFILSTIGLGLALSGFVQTMAQLAAIAPIVITGTCMLGGAFWPAEVMPKFMQTLGKFVPPGWAAQGLNALILRDAGLSGVLAPSAVLLGFAAVFLAIGVARVRYE